MFRTTRNLTRASFRFLRTMRYIADLMVWSRIFIARRAHDSIEINENQRREKGVHYAQPHLEISGRIGAEHIQHGFSVIYDVLFANLKKPDHLVDTYYALPGPSFVGVYLWDSAFIAQIWKYWDRKIAFDVLQSVIKLRDGDRLQHVVTDYLQSQFTQPPLIEWSLAKTYDGLIDSSLDHRLKSSFPILKRYHDWINKHRRLPNGLYFWVHPYESGVENAPRFSTRDNRSMSDTRKLAAPDLSAYVVLQCEALARLASRLGYGEEEHEYKHRARTIGKLVNEVLWDEQDGLYYDRNIETGAFVRSKTIASLVPIAAGVPNLDQAQCLHEQICDASAFGSLIPFPSVALNDPDFDRDMWRGPVWINMAYLVLEGLRRYGFTESYGQLAWRLCDGVYRVLQDEHQVYEFYDPECFHTRELTRKKGNLWKAVTLGTRPQKDFVGWTGLVNSILIEGLIGFSREDAIIRLQPNFPNDAAGLSFRLALPQDECTLNLTVLAGAKSMEGSVEYRHNNKCFHINRGDKFEYHISN